MTHKRIGECNFCGYCCGLPQNEEQKALMAPCPRLILLPNDKTQCSVWGSSEWAHCWGWFPQTPQDLIDGTGWRAPCSFNFVEE